MQVINNVSTVLWDVIAANLQITVLNVSLSIIRKMTCVFLMFLLIMESRVVLLLNNLKVHSKIHKKLQWTHLVTQVVKREKMVLNRILLLLEEIALGVTTGCLNAQGEPTLTSSK